MTLSPNELLTLAGLLRVVLRLDTLSPMERASALEDVVTELDLHAEESERTTHERASYRDAGIFVRRVAVDLDAWMTRAERELAEPDALRTWVDQVVSDDAKGAILRALHLVASRGRLTPKEEIFLAWLAMLWREATRAPAVSEVGSATFASLPRTDRLIFAALLVHALEASGLAADARAHARARALESMRTTDEELAPFEERAAKEIRGAGHLSALASFGVTSTRSREAMLRALFVVAYEGGFTPREEAFLRGLASSWSMI